MLRKPNIIESKRIKRYVHRRQVAAQVLIALVLSLAYNFNPTGNICLISILLCMISYGVLEGIADAFIEDVQVTDCEHANGTRINCRFRDRNYMI